jgi:carbamoyltransferase
MPEEEDTSLVESVGSAGPLRDLYNWVEYKLGSELFTNFIRRIFVEGNITPKTQQKVSDIVHEKYGISKDKIIFIDHHTNHCLTPLYFFGLEETKEDMLLVSLDGAGDGLCSRVFKYNHKDKNLTQVCETPYMSSPALMYREMTMFLGMKPLEHEHKVMGLAAYVDDDKYFNDIYEELRKVVCLDKETLTFKSAFYINYAHLYLQERFKMKRFDNLAAALQKFTEKLVLDWIDELVRATGVSTLAFSGGIFMNVKLNQKILQMESVKKAYFQPSCGDDSLIIGAAANEFREDEIALKPINTMFLGHDYNNKEVEKYLKEKNGI